MPAQPRNGGDTVAAETTGCIVVRKIVLGVVAGMLVLSGCGGTEPGSSTESKASASGAASKKAAEDAAEEREQAAAARKAKQTAVYRECKAVVGPLDETLTALNSRLGVGVPFAKYSDLVGEAPVAYDKLLREAKTRGGISDPCVKRVGTPLESALNAYTSAYSTSGRGTALDEPCPVTSARRPRQGSSPASARTAPSA